LITSLPEGEIMPGFKVFTRGYQITEADINDYLMLQTVMVFDDEVSRNESLALVLRGGLVTYLKNSDAIQVYTGTAWETLARYDNIPSVDLTISSTKLSAMQMPPPREIDEGEPILFYSIFSNYADDNWSPRIWR